MIRWAPVFALIAGCKPPDNITGGGIELWEHLPFDGTRTWEYISSNVDIPYKLVGRMRPDDPDPDLSADFNIYHIDFTKDCVQPDPGCIEDDPVRTLAFSSDVSNGILVHSFEQGGVVVDFDPPLVLAPKDVDVDEAVETVTDGATWTSTLLGFEPCEGIVNMQGSQFEATNCSARLLLQDGDNLSETNYGLPGDYWLSKGLGIIGIQLDGEDDVWGLSSMVCEPEEDCGGRW